MAQDDSKDQRNKPADYDVVLVHGRTEDGTGLRAVRSRPDRVELTEIFPLKEGQPLHAREVVALHPRAESPLLWDVEVQYRTGDGTAPTASRSGPPQVASERYRHNWELVFGGSKKKQSTN